MPAIVSPWMADGACEGRRRQANKPGPRHRNGAKRTSDHDLASDSCDVD